MMKRVLVASAALVLSATLAHAQEVKLASLRRSPGSAPSLASRSTAACNSNLKLRADEFKPYKINIIKRDDKNPSGADSKIAVQELLTQENVDALAGWIYSPNAIASAPVVTAGKKIGVIMNAAPPTSHHVAVLRAHLVQHVHTPATRWGEAAAKQLKAKTAVIGYSDFPPGKDSLAAFKRAFERAAARSLTKSHGRTCPGAGLHAVLPARQGQETRRVLRLRAGWRSCARRSPRPTARSV